jgi:hypothetical protein
MLFKNLYQTYKLLNKFLEVSINFTSNITESKNKLGSSLLSGGKLNSNVILTFSVFQHIYKYFSSPHNQQMHKLT